MIFCFTSCILCILKAVGTGASSDPPDFMNDRFLQMQSGKTPFAETAPSGHLYGLLLALSLQGTSHLSSLSAEGLNSKHSCRGMFSLWSPVRQYEFSGLKVQRDFLVPITRARAASCRRSTHIMQTKTLPSAYFCFCSSWLLPPENPAPAIVMLSYPRVGDQMVTVGLRTGFLDRAPARESDSLRGARGSNP